MTKLRGKKPTEIKGRLKLFLYGESGAGKTTASLSFPAPYIIDTEDGATKKNYVELIVKNNGAHCSINNLDELLEEVRNLLIVEHDYKTLVIDSLSVLYSEENDSNEEKILAKGKEIGYAQHIQQTNKKIKKLYRLLDLLDMNVIVTSHAKTKYAKTDRNPMEAVGTTWNCYKDSDYAFDLMLELKLLDENRTERAAWVFKSRMQDEFKQGEVFEFSYAEIAKRYGQDLLEKKSIPIALATEEQVSRLNFLIKQLNVDEETTEKWLKKAKRGEFNEMDTETIQKCIDFLEQKLSNLYNQPIE